MKPRNGWNSMAEARPAGFPAEAKELYSAAQVTAAHERMAGEILARPFAADTVLLGVALGGLLPMARLASLLSIDLEMDICQVSRYGHALKGAALSWLREPQARLQGRSVIVVDDICDIGQTLLEVTAYCRSAGAVDVLTAVLVRKRFADDRQVYVPDIVGLDAGDEFVFGCGMDYRGRWRHLPEIFSVHSGKST
jgi:hypoxanthine phosphoribosyltransferase